MRRHLSASQRAVIAIDLLPVLEQEAKQRQRLGLGRGKRVRKELRTLSENGDGRASQIAARVTKTNAAYVKALKVVQQQAPELLESVRDGTLSVPEARELARSPTSIRRKVLGVVENGGARRKVLRLIREATIVARKASARRYANANIAGNNQNILHGDMKILHKRLEDESVRLFLSDLP